MCPSYYFEEKMFLSLWSITSNLAVKIHTSDWFIPHVTIYRLVINATAMYIHVFLKIVAVSMIAEWPIKTKWWWFEGNY